MSGGDKAAEILARVRESGAVPSLSPLAVRLVELAADDTTSASDLQKIIEQDPGLVARLLRLVNSPVLRRSEDEITSVSRAVVLLGLREVRIMALSISLRDTLPLKRGDQDYYLYWRSSLHRAVMAREIARTLSLAESEEAFVAGLLLELGLPILLVVLEEGEREGFPGFGASLAEQLAWERTRVGVDHRQVGRQVLSDWGLPALLVECQQVVEEAKARQAPPLVRVTDFARRATEAFFLPQVNLADIYRVARLWFGLEDERVNQVLASTLDYVGEAAQALDIELNREADLLAIMEKANQALSRLSTQMAPALQQVVRGGGEAPKQAPEVARVREETMVDTLEAVAHEIRNPLMSVGGFARRLAEMTAGADERARQYAQVLLSQAARLDQVLSEMLAVTTPYRPRYQQLELLDLVREVSRSLQEDPPSNLSRPLPAIRWHLPEAPLPMRGDRAGLVSMLRLMVGYGAHLLSPPDKTLHVHLARRGERAVFTVFGPGRSEPAEDDALAGKSFGPELGLLRSRRIAEAHGGYLSVGSAPKGEGFVLTASLPLEPPGA